jgi:hypothetical protein
LHFPELEKRLEEYLTKNANYGIDRIENLLEKYFGARQYCRRKRTESLFLPPMLAAFTAISIAFLRRAYFNNAKEDQR